MKKTYIAYAIYDVELGCGCIESRFVYVYGQYGNEYKKKLIHTKKLKRRLLIVWLRMIVTGGM